LIERELVSDEYWGSSIQHLGFKKPKSDEPKSVKSKSVKSKSVKSKSVEPYWEFRVSMYDTPESIVEKYPNTERLRETCRYANIHHSGHRAKLAQRLFDQFEYRAGPLGYYDECFEIFTPEEIASAARLLSFFL
jgi:hypothetical protein